MTESLYNLARQCLNILSATHSSAASDAKKILDEAITNYEVASDMLSAAISSSLARLCNALNASEDAQHDAVPSPTDDEYLAETLAELPDDTSAHDVRADRLADARAIMDMFVTHDDAPRYTPARRRYEADQMLKRILPDEGTEENATAPYSPGAYVTEHMSTQDAPACPNESCPFNRGGCMLVRLVAGQPEELYPDDCPNCKKKAE